ncbi:MAG TPA: P1 family peptidase [Thermoleophilia bacterium]|nr:P1 family peptidase [Thermoleophilia bacterium]
MATVRARARELGITIGVLPTGPLNAITDVPGVMVGHCTVSWGGPDLPRGSGPARTGVTAVIPHGDDIWHQRVVAGAFAANGVGEVVGMHAIREWGLIETPIMLTNSQSVGAVYDATVRWMMARDPLAGIEDAVMPVVGECDDSMLNDMRGMHVREEHVHAALDSATTGPVAEGCVGAGTGMTCFDFKGGIGTSSRIVSPYPGAIYTVGVLVMTNFGTRERLTVDGVPVGREIRDLMPEVHGEGSCIVLLATDAPLTARQCERLAKRCSLGLAVTGSYAADSSGEFMVAFTTAHRVPRVTSGPVAVTSVANDAMAELFAAAVDATAEAVIDSLCAATDTVGRDGNRAYALPLDRLVAVMERFGRSVHLPSAG